MCFRANAGSACEIQQETFGTDDGFVRHLSFTALARQSFHVSFRMHERIGVAMLKITIHCVLRSSLYAYFVAGAMLAGSGFAQAEAVVGKPLTGAEPVNQRAPAVRPVRKTESRTRSPAAIQARRGAETVTKRLPVERSAATTRAPTVKLTRRDTDAVTRRPPAAPTVRQTQPRSVKQVRRGAETVTRRPVVEPPVRKTVRKTPAPAVNRSRVQHVRVTPNTPAVRSARKAEPNSQPLAAVQSRIPHARPTPPAAADGSKQILGLTISPASASWKLEGLRPRLLRLLTRVQDHFGKHLHIVSGCRSKSHNRRVNGAKRSQHLHCKAADFMVPGVSKYRLAAFLKQLPGRGGVGLYCRSSFVHLDVGPVREWHWRCRKRKARAKQTLSAPQNDAKSSGRRR